MGQRQGAVWVGMLALMQGFDVWTTGLDRAKGTLEGMPLTANILDESGLLGLAVLKGLAVLVVAVSLVLTYTWSRRSREAAALHRFVLNVCRVAAVAIALASLNNAVLFASL